MSKIEPIDETKRHLMLMDPEEAKRRAAKIPVMKPGVIITMSIEVALMWMKQNNMKGSWRGNLLVARRKPIAEKQGE